MFLQVRSLCLGVGSGGSAILIGTTASEIIEWNPKSNDITCIIETHGSVEKAKGVRALATHPKLLEFATGGDDRSGRT